MLRLPVLIFFLVSAHAAIARADGPVPPCGDAVVPGPAAPGSPPIVQTWRTADLPGPWTPPGCSGWTAPGFRLMTAISGRIEGPDGLGAASRMLSRFAAVSQMTAIRFWAVTDKEWQSLVHEAYALDGPSSGTPRPDFTDEDLVPGKTLVYSETDNGSGRDKYRMQVLVRTPTRIVVETENVSTIRFLLLPLFHPGDLQALYVLTQMPDRHWVFYSLTRVGTNASSLISDHAPSMVNRAVALYRYFAGIPTDQDPPAMR